LKSAFEGALAGGGDPATSPLYVFGPFLRLLAVSGAGAVSFGAPIWMVVGTVVVLSLITGTSCGGSPTAAACAKRSSAGGR